MGLTSTVTTVFLFFSLILGSACSAGLLDRKNFRTEVKEIEQPGNAGEFRHGPGDYGRTITVDNQKRYYEIHVPGKYDKGTALPVVLVFHGGGGDQGTIRFESQMDATADREGFLVVYAAGTNRRLILKNRMLLWNDGRPFDDGTLSKVDDVKFVQFLLEDLQKLFKVKLDSVFACGYSNGAQFSYRLAKQLPDRIAAMAAVAGQRAADDIFPPPSRPMAVMQFSGMEDTIGPYHGGKPHFDAELQTVLKPVTETIKSWVDFNGCSPAPEEKRIGRAVMKRYSSCRGGAEVILWTLEDGGHTWPGGRVVPAAEKLGLGNINKDINASDLMWDFFMRHPLPGK